MKSKKAFLLFIVLLILTGCERGEMLDDAKAQKAFEAYSEGRHQEALPGLLEVANTGNSKAAFILGVMYETGQAVEVNFKEALKWYDYSAQRGHGTAYSRLALAHFFGELGLKEDRKEALKWIKLAAGSGQPPGLYMLGLYYENGFLVGEDLSEAVRLYQLSANSGFPRAMRKLGGMYLTGAPPLELDSEKAFGFFNSAALSGDPISQNMAGAMYLEGTGVVKSPEKAFRWFKLASEQGLAQARCNLGDLYALGVGTQKDTQKAARLLSDPQNQGDPVCADLRLKHGITVVKDKENIDAGEPQ